MPVSVADQPDQARCGFCGHGPGEANRLIAGLTAWICDECVRVCAGILDEVDPPAAEVSQVVPVDVTTEHSTTEHSTTEPDIAQAVAPADDPVMVAIVAAQTLAVTGDRAEARAAYERIWADLGPDGDPLHVVALAHQLADLQEDIEDEVAWDLRALAAADSLTDERARAYHASLQVRGFYPSLHLNLADDYARLGRRAQAREHLAAAEAALPALGEDGYGRMIRSGIAGVRERLDGGAP